MRRLTSFAALILSVLLVSLPGFAQQDVISTIIGGGPNNIPAARANLYDPIGVAVDASGNFYIAAYQQNRVFKVTAGGTLTVVAGLGTQGYTGDGVVGGAANATLNHPIGVAVDASGNIYISDTNNCAVRKVTTAKTITTIAGTTCGFSGDGGKGTAAQIYLPYGLALDGLGNLFIADYQNCRVRKLVLASDNISTAVGNGSCAYSGDGGAAPASSLAYPSGLAIDSANNLYIGDSNNYVVRMVTKTNNKVSTIAGNHTYGFAGDGAKATSAEMTYPYGVAVNSAGTLVTFTDYANQRVRQFTVGGNIKTVAGNGTACQDNGANVCGEGGAATSAQLYNPFGVAVTTGGKIYFANRTNYVVDAVTVGGNLTVAAGNHSPSYETLVTGTPATGAELNNPYGIASDAAGNIYVTDSHNFMVREYVQSSGLLNFFAGTGIEGFTGDGGAAKNAELQYNYGVAKDAAGNVYIGDTSNCIVREVNTAGNINLFAGVVVTNPQCGYTGDGGPATSARLYYPYGVAVDTKGAVYIADYQEHVVRKVSGGTINTIAGIGGLYGYSGDGGPATSALLQGPTAVAVDPAGNVFIADYNNCRVREINGATGIITTIAGTGVCANGGDGLATSNPVEYPQGLAVDANDNLFIGDYSNRVRWVAPNGYMTTIAGTGAAGFTGDGGLATSALLNEPTGIALDPAGNILASDYSNNRVRSITAFSALNTNTGALAFGLTSVGSTSSPQSLSLSAYGPVTISNISASANYSEADNCPASMTNGSTCTMYVYFVPAASGSLTGNVTVNSNGFFSQTNTVSLTGLGSSISLAGAPLSFGNRLVKTTSTAKTVTVMNNGTAAIKMGAITSTNTTDYNIASNTCPASGANLAAGASCAINVTFGPKSTGAKRGTIVVNDSDPSSPQLIGLSGTGISNVVLAPNTVTFATTAVGVASVATKITLTNNTGVSVTLGATPVTVTGPFVNAATTTCTANLVIANSGTCVINVQFKPTKTGYASGSISVADSDVTSPQSVVLQGYGTGVKFTPATVNFGTVNKGTQVSSTVTIANVGTTNVFFTGAELSGANSADFAVNYNDNAPCGNTSANPLLPGKTCQITVYFDPSKSAAEKASYLVFDNSIGSPQSLTLTGRGQ
jgi:sugar lactone lactonase YvrE